MIDKTKLCSKCKIGVRDVKHAYCKKCRDNYRADYYAIHGDEIRRVAKRYSKEYYAANAKKISEKKKIVYYKKKENNN